MHAVLGPRINFIPKFVDFAIRNHEGVFVRLDLNVKKL